MTAILKHADREKAAAAMQLRDAVRPNILEFGARVLAILSGDWPVFSRFPLDLGCPDGFCHVSRSRND